VEPRSNTPEERACQACQKALSDWYLRKTCLIGEARVNDLERELRHDAVADTFCELRGRECTLERGRDRHLTTTFIEARYGSRLTDARRGALTAKRTAPGGTIPLPVDGETIPEFSGEVLASDLREPSLALEIANDLSLAREELFRLPVRARETLWYSELGFSASEIAAMQGRSAAAVRQERRRARRALPSGLFR